MASPQGTDVLLETMAVYPYQSSQSSQAGHIQERSHSHRTQPQGARHLARTLAAQAGMTNKWLYKEGLISVKEQWVKIHYPATAR